MLFWAFFLFFGSLFQCLTSLKLSLLGSQPKQMIIGQNGKLQCMYDLEGAELYSLKWYKNGKEFYRFMPSQERKQTIFDAPGVIIDMQYSNLHELSLLSINLETAGIYRCEVSTEAPDFDTMSETIQVDVISLPIGPKISGLVSSYSAGDMVRANCSTSNSLPPPLLLWYINKEAVVSETRSNRSRSLYSSSSSVQPPMSFLRTFNKDNLTSSHLELVFTLKLSHFKDGKLKLKCTAFLEQIFMRSDEVSVEQIPAKSASKDVYGDTQYPGLFQELDARTQSDAVKSPLENPVFGDIMSSGGTAPAQRSSLSICSSTLLVVCLMRRPTHQE